MPNPRIELPKNTAKTTIELKYTNLNGEEMGPFQVSFDPVSETLRNAKALLEQVRTSWVSFRDYDGKTLLYFTSLMVHRGGLQKITYGIDTEKPDRDFPFPARDEPGMSPIGSDITVFLEIFSATKFVSVQLTFKDGVSSSVALFQRQLRIRLITFEPESFKKKSEILVQSGKHGF